MRGSPRLSPPALPAVLLLLASAAAALPGLYGVRGMYRTVSAMTPEAGSYSFFVSVLYQKAAVDDTVGFVRPTFPPIDTTLAIGDTEHYLDGTLQLGLAVTDEVEAGFTVDYLANGYQYDQVHPRGDFVGILDIGHGFGRARAAVKYGMEMPVPDLHAGGMLWLGVPLGEPEPDSAGDYGGFWDRGDPMLQTRRPFTSTGSVSWGIMALGSYRYPLMGEDLELEGNLNVGYCGFGQEYGDSTLGTVSRTDGAVDLGVGVSLNAIQASLFVEYTLRAFTGRSSDAWGNPMRLGAGLRLFDPDGSFLDVVGELGLTGFDRHEADPYRTGELPLPGGIPGDWGLMLCLGFDRGMVSRDDLGGTGTVAGTVTDASTGQPLDSAMVSFPGSPVSPTYADPVTGFFSAPVIAGTVVVQAQADGYVPLSSTVTVSPGRTATTDFRMEPAAPPEGTVTGTVTRAATGEPVVATVTDESTGRSAQTDGSGLFTLELPEGARTLRAQAEGLLAGTQTVSVEGGGTSTVDFELGTALQQGQTLSFANIYFDSGSDVIQPSSYAVLDEIVELLRSNSTVTVRVVGHTDSDGSESYNQDLSRRRAQSVRSYLVQRGIGSERLTTSGMGETQPVASNATAAGKAQNRRIEFVVTSAPWP